MSFVPVICRLCSCSWLRRIILESKLLLLVIFSLKLALSEVPQLDITVLSSVTCDGVNNHSQITAPTLPLAAGLRPNLPAYLALGRDHSRRAQVAGADERLSVILPSDPWAAAITAPDAVVAIPAAAPFTSQSTSPTKVLDSVAPSGAAPAAAAASAVAVTAEAIATATAAAAAAAGISTSFTAAADAAAVEAAASKGDVIMGASVAAQSVLAAVGRMEAAALPLLLSTNRTWLLRLTSLAATGGALPQQLLPPPTGKFGGAPASPLLLLYRRDWWGALTASNNVTTAAAAAVSTAFVSSESESITPGFTASEFTVGAATAEEVMEAPLPPTWRLFVVLVLELMGRDLDGDGSPDYPLCVDLMPGCKGGALLTAIYASLAQSRGTQQGLWFNQTDLTPLLGGPALLAAMRLYGALATANAVTFTPGAAAASGLNANDDNSTGTAPGGADPWVSATLPPCGAVNPLFAAGRCLFSVDWASAALWLERSRTDIPPGSLGLALLPGSEVVEGGLKEEEKGGSVEAAAAAEPADAAAPGAVGNSFPSPAAAAADTAGKPISSSSGTVAPSGSSSSTKAALDDLLTCTAALCPHADVVKRTSLETAATVLSRTLQRRSGNTDTNSNDFPTPAAAAAAAAAAVSTQVAAAAAASSVSESSAPSSYLYEVQGLPENIVVNRAPLLGEGQDTWLLLPPAVSLQPAGFAPPPPQQQQQRSPSSPSVGGISQWSQLPPITISPNGLAPQPPPGPAQSSSSPLLQKARQMKAEEFIRLVSYQLYLKYDLVMQLVASSGSALPDASNSSSNSTAGTTGHIEWDASMYKSIVVLSGGSTSTSTTATMGEPVAAADVAVLLDLDLEDTQRLAQVIYSSIRHHNAALDISLPYSSQYRSVLDQLAVAVIAVHRNASLSSMAAAAVVAEPSDPLLGLQQWAVAQIMNISQSFPYQPILLRLYAHGIGAILPTSGLRNPAPPPSVFVSPPASASRIGHLRSTLIAVVMSVFLVVVISAVGLIWYMRRRRANMTFPGTGGCMPGPHPNTTLVVTDVQGSTSLWEVLSGDLMDEVLHIHHRVVRQAISRWHGYEVFTEGDAFVVAFHLPEDALDFAVGLQAALLDADWPPELLEQPDCCEVWARRHSAQLPSPASAPANGPLAWSKRTLAADLMTVAAGNSGTGGGGTGYQGITASSTIGSGGGVGRPLTNPGGFSAGSGFAGGGVEGSPGSRPGRRILNALSHLRNSSLESSSGFELGLRPLAALSRFPKLSTPTGGGTSTLLSAAGAPSFLAPSPGGVSLGVGAGPPCSTSMGGVTSSGQHRWFSMPFSNITPTNSVMPPTKIGPGVGTTLTVVDPTVAAASAMAVPGSGGGHSLLHAGHASPLTGTRSAVEMEDNVMGETIRGTMGGSALIFQHHLQSSDTGSSSTLVTVNGLGAVAAAVPALATSSVGSSRFQDKSVRYRPSHVVSLTSFGCGDGGGGSAALDELAKADGGGSVASGAPVTTAVQSRPLPTVAAQSVSTGSTVAASTGGGSAITLSSLAEDRLAARPLPLLGFKELPLTQSPIPPNVVEVEAAALAVTEGDHVAAEGGGSGGGFTGVCGAVAANLPALSHGVSVRVHDWRNAGLPWSMSAVSAIADQRRQSFKGTPSVATTTIPAPVMLAVVGRSALTTVPEGLHAMPEALAPGKTAAVARSVIVPDVLSTSDTTYRQLQQLTQHQQQQTLLQYPAPPWPPLLLQPSAIQPSDHPSLERQPQPIHSPHAVSKEGNFIRSQVTASGGDSGSSGVLASQPGSSISTSARPIRRTVLELEPVPEGGAGDVVNFRGHCSNGHQNHLIHAHPASNYNVNGCGGGGGGGGGDGKGGGKCHFPNGHRSSDDAGGADNSCSDSDGHSSIPLFRISNTSDPPPSQEVIALDVLNAAATTPGTGVPALGYSTTDSVGHPGNSLLLPASEGSRGGAAERSVSASATKGGGGQVVSAGVFKSASPAATPAFHNTHSPSWLPILAFRRHANPDRAKARSHNAESPGYLASHSLRQEWSSRKTSTAANDIAAAAGGKSAAATAAAVPTSAVLKAPPSALLLARFSTCGDGGGAAPSTNFGVWNLGAPGSDGQCATLDACRSATAEATAGSSGGNGSIFSKATVAVDAGDVQVRGNGGGGVSTTADEVASAERFLTPSVLELEAAGDSMDWRSCVAWDTTTSSYAYDVPPLTPSTARTMSHPPRISGSSSPPGTSSSSTAVAATGATRRSPPMKLISRGLTTFGSHKTSQLPQGLLPKHQKLQQQRNHSNNFHAQLQVDRSYHPGSRLGSRENCAQMGTYFHMNRSYHPGRTYSPSPGALPIGGRTSILGMGNMRSSTGPSAGPQGSRSPPQPPPPVEDGVGGSGGGRSGGGSGVASGRHVAASGLSITQHSGSTVALEGWFNRQMTLRRLLLQQPEPNPLSLQQHPKPRLQRSASAQRSMATSVHHINPGGGGGMAGSVQTGTTIGSIATSGTATGITIGEPTLAVGSPGQLLSATLLTTLQEAPSGYRSLLHRLNSSMRRTSAVSRQPAGSPTLRATGSGFTGSQSAMITTQASGALELDMSPSAANTVGGCANNCAVAASNADVLGDFLTMDAPEMSEVSELGKNPVTTLSATGSTSDAATPTMAAIAPDHISLDVLMTSPGGHSSGAAAAATAAMGRCSPSNVFNTMGAGNMPTPLDATSTANTPATGSCMAATTTASDVPAEAVVAATVASSTIVANSAVEGKPTGRYNDIGPSASGFSTSRPAPLQMEVANGHDGGGGGDITAAATGVSSSLALTGHHGIYHRGRSSNMMFQGHVVNSPSSPLPVMALAAGVSRGSMFMDLLWRDINMAAAAASTSERCGAESMNATAPVIPATGGTCTINTDFLSTSLQHHHPDGWLYRAAAGVGGAVYTVAAALRSLFEQISAEGAAVQLGMYGSLGMTYGREPTGSGGIASGLTGPLLAGEAQMVLRGLRLRVGLHSGPSDSEVAFLTQGSPAGVRYLGRFLATSKDVCDAAAGGVVLASGATFRVYQHRQREARVQRSAGVGIGGIKLELMLLHLGEYLLGSAANAGTADDADLYSGKSILATTVMSGIDASSLMPAAALPPSAASATGSDEAPVELYGVVCPWLLPRLAILKSPVRARRQAVPGCLSAPAGMVAPVFCNVLGVESLLAWERVVQERQAAVAAAAAATSTVLGRNSPVMISHAALTAAAATAAQAGAGRRGGGAVVNNALELLRRAAMAAAARHGGYVVAVSADGGHWVLVFGSATAAVSWGLDMLEAMLGAAWPESFLEHELTEEVWEDGVLVKKGLRLRIGVDLGCAMLRPVPRTGRLDYVGRPMNRAARIAAKSKAAAMFVSGAVWDAARGSLERPALAICLGQAQLKGVRELVELWALRPAPSGSVSGAATAAATAAAAAAAAPATAAVAGPPPGGASAKVAESKCDSGAEPPIRPFPLAGSCEGSPSRIAKTTLAVGPSPELAATAMTFLPNA